MLGVSKSSIIDLTGQIPTYRLDEIIRRDITVIKVNVEGFEPRIIVGMEELFKYYKV